MRTQGERPSLISKILVDAARRRQTLTYGQLAAQVGGIARGMGKELKPIEEYCVREALPPLTALVVRTDTGRPGRGFGAVEIESQAQFEEILDSVFGFDWNSAVLAGQAQSPLP